MRYSVHTPLDANQVTPGTQGWGSPESTGSDGQLVHPLSSEIFSFGLLVAYIILGMDAYQIPRVKKFLMNKYFPSGAMHGPDEPTEKMKGAQQWMINTHFNLFVDFIFGALNDLDLPDREATIVRTVLHQTLVFGPEQRAQTFSDIFDSLDVKYAKGKRR